MIFQRLMDINQTWRFHSIILGEELMQSKLICKRSNVLAAMVEEFDDKSKMEVSDQINLLN